MKQTRRYRSLSKWKGISCARSHFLHWRDVRPEGVPDIRSTGDAGRSTSLTGRSTSLTGRNNSAGGRSEEYGQPSAASGEQAYPWNHSQLPDLSQPAEL